MSTVVNLIPHARSVTFTIPGRIGGKGRHRSFMRHGKIMHATPEKTVSQEGIVAHHAAQAMREQRCEQLTGPVSLSITITRHHPKSWPRRLRENTAWVTGKPDLDNHAKLICDGLNHSGIWQDDAQVAQLMMRRWYRDDIPEGVIISVAPLDARDAG